MTNFGFVINNRTCIGCHACSTACKSENEVPLGVYRTWVKYTEVGRYPDVRRHFQVTRCNHCANPPCARICPVTAMYQRDDGIVEFDPDVCIGCKACLQACPYDAIHIDPDTGTAAKCHYCSHRTDIGLEPACVVVCPEHAILAGDLDDPSSEISRVLAKENVSVRKPEQGTAPKLFYIEGNDVSLHPTATAKPSTFMWADVTEHETANGHHADPGGGTADSGVAIRTPGAQGAPEQGPIQLSDRRVAEHMVQVGYNAQHKVPWHWPVPAYLVTKGIGAGVAIVFALLYFAGLITDDRNTMIGTAGIALLFTGITTALLVVDLERPERFLRILLRPQWKSWLTKGAFILVGYTIVVTAWLGLEVVGVTGFRKPLIAAAAVLGVGTAVYTAFLFGQAEGRDLWQSTLFPFHLLLQASFLGAAGLFVVGAALGLDTTLFVRIFAAGLALDLFVTLLGEFGMPHASESAAHAAHAMTHGKYKTHFWWGAIVLGHLAPLGVLVASTTTVAVAAAAVMAVIGLYAYEHAFVMAPQEVPNS